MIGFKNARWYYTDYTVVKFPLLSCVFLVERLYLNKPYKCIAYKY